MNYYEHWIGAFRKKTNRLSMTERGAYRELIDEIYAMDGEGLPPEPHKLYNIAGARTEVECAAVDEVVRRYFTQGDDGLLYQERSDEEVTKARRRIEAARANGKKSKGRPKTQKEPTGLSPGDPKETQPVVPQSTDTLLPTVESKGAGGHDAPPPPQAPLSPPPPSVPAAPAPVEKSVGKKPRSKKARDPATWIPSAVDPSAPPVKPEVKVKWVVPSTIPVVEWSAFVEMRRKMTKIPFTDYARDRIIEKLEQMQSRGIDIAKVLDLSTTNGWRDVFEPKGPQPPKGGPPSKSAQALTTLEGLKR